MKIITIEEEELMFNIIENDNILMIIIEYQNITNHRRRPRLKNDPIFKPYSKNFIHENNFFGFLFLKLIFAQKIRPDRHIH